MFSVFFQPLGRIKHASAEFGVSGSLGHIPPLLPLWCCLFPKSLFSAALFLNASFLLEEPWFTAFFSIYNNVLPSLFFFSGPFSGPEVVRGPVIDESRCLECVFTSSSFPVVFTHFFFPLIYRHIHFNHCFGSPWRAKLSLLFAGRCVDSLPLPLSPYTFFSFAASRILRYLLRGSFLC